MNREVVVADAVEWANAYDGPKFHALLCDPPYHLTSIVKRFGKEGSAPAKFGSDGRFSRLSKGFMGQEWDGGDVAFRPETWAAFGSVLHPGAHLLAFGGTRTWHRLAVAIEDAGFEIRDTLMWLYGQGFPKSHNVSKYLPPEEADNWKGYGTALKPAWEPVLLARKPCDKLSVAECCDAYGCGALNIDGTRIPIGDEYDPSKTQRQQHSQGAIPGAFGAASLIGKEIPTYNGQGRWPANLIHDGSDEVVELMPQSKDGVAVGGNGKASSIYGTKLDRSGGADAGYGSSGSAARFFYCAKASKAERGNGNIHPTVKPIDLCRYLALMVLPPASVQPRRIFVPFAGSGSEMIGAAQAGWEDVVGVEISKAYADIAVKRLDERIGML